MTLSVGFRITVSLLILLPKLRGSDSCPGRIDSHRTRQPSLDAQRRLSRKLRVKARMTALGPAVARRWSIPGVAPRGRPRAFAIGKPAILRYLGWHRQK